MLRPIPLNALTLYADLDQSLAGGVGVPGTISRRQENGQRRLYATIREGVGRRQVYLGTVCDRKAEAAAQRYRDDMEEGRQRRRTVSALKRLGIPAPPLEAGRVLEALARAGLFEAGGVLVGTTAYQCYPCIVGHMLPSASLATRDVDLSIARMPCLDCLLWAGRWRMCCARPIRASAPTCAVRRRPRVTGTAQGSRLIS